MDVIALQPNAGLDKGGTALLREGIQLKPGGMAVNCASAIANLGGNARLVMRIPNRGVLGDLIVRQLSSLFRGQEAEIAIPFDAEPCSCISLVQTSEENEVGHPRQRTFMFHRSHEAFITSDEFISLRKQFASSLRHIHFAGIGDSDDQKTELLLHKGVRETLEKLKLEGITLSCDFVPRKETHSSSSWQSMIRPGLELMDFMMPSDYETLMWCPQGVLDNERARVEKAGRAFQSDFSRSFVVVKSSNRGCYVPSGDSGRGRWVPPIEAIHVLDPTGAGDVWCGGFLHAMMGYSRMQACIVGNCVAGDSLRSWGGSGVVSSMDKVIQIAERHPLWQDVL